MNVLFLIQPDSTGGPAVYFNMLVKELRQLGLNVLVETVPTLYGFVTKNVRQARAIGHKLAKKYTNEIDLIHSGIIIHEAVAGDRIATELEVPHVVTIHEIMSYDYAMLNKGVKAKLIAKYYHWVEKGFLKKADAVTTSSSLEEGLIRRFFLNVENVVVIPHGSDHVPDINIPYEEKEGVSTSKPTYKKGGDITIKIALSSPLIPFKIFGYHEPIGCELPNVALKHQKDFDKLCEEIARTKLWILPSRHDNFSIATLEAMRLGVVPMVSEYVGIKEWIDGAGKILPLDVNVWIKTLQKMYGNDLSFESKRAVEISKRMTWEECAKRHLQVYKAVIKGR